MHVTPQAACPSRGGLITDHLFFPNLPTIGSANFILRDAARVDIRPHTCTRGHATSSDTGTDQPCPGSPEGTRSVQLKF